MFLGMMAGQYILNKRYKYYMTLLFKKIYLLNMKNKDNELALPLSRVNKVCDIATSSRAIRWFYSLTDTYRQINWTYGTEDGCATF